MGHYQGNLQTKLAHKLVNQFLVNRSTMYTEGQIFSHSTCEKERLLAEVCNI